MYQTLELIKDGHIDGTVGQQPYLQGYLPVMYAYQRAILGRAEARASRRQLLHGERDRHEGQCRHLPRPREALPGMSDGSEFRLSALDITKQFAGVRALNSVNFNVRAGGIHGLLGANGAGKSTLIGVLAGAVLPDRGTVSVDGRLVTPGSVIESRRAGIAVVHQELMLFPDRTVEENITATSMPAGRSGFIRFSDRKRSARKVLDSLSSSLDLSARIKNLPLAQRQLVEIGRALCGGGNIFVLDEPTSALSQPEAQACSPRCAPSRTKVRQSSSSRIGWTRCSR